MRDFANDLQPRLATAITFDPNTSRNMRAKADLSEGKYGHARNLIVKSQTTLKDLVKALIKCSSAK